MHRSRSGAAFIEHISTQALNSAAVNHPYLQSLRNGDFPDIHLAYQDFAFQYGLYTTQFVRYLSAVIENLERPGHRQILQSNLAEEKGNAQDIDLPPEVLDSIGGQSHASLFRRFQEALGVDADYRGSATDADVGSRWSREFLQLCGINEFVGIGAIGIGTELIVSSIYDQILQGLEAHSHLTMAQRVFFDLHSECDDEHAAQMILIAEELARSSAAIEQIEYGVRRAISLRAGFWDQMLERAQSFSATDSPADEGLHDLRHQTGL